MKVTTVSRPPASRIASVESKLHFDSNFTSEFKFDDDGWGNQGSGYVSLKGDRVEVTLRISKDAGDNWGIFDGKKTFMRNQPEFGKANNSDSTGEIGIKIGTHRASLTIPAYWNSKYDIQSTDRSCIFNYKSSSLGDYTLFEIIEASDKDWAELLAQHQGDSGNTYKLLLKQGKLNFVYRTHVVEGDPIEDEYYTILNDFKESVSKTFKVNK
jgi:hypothetical protein